MAHFPFQEITIPYDPRSMEFLLTIKKEYSAIVLQEDTQRGQEIAELRQVIYDKILGAVATVLVGMERDIIGLSFFFGVSHDEIAAIYNTSQPTISYKLKQALKHLRTAFEDNSALMEPLERLRELEHIFDFYY